MKSLNRWAIGALIFVALAMVLGSPPAIAVPPWATEILDLNYSGNFAHTGSMRGSIGVRARQLSIIKGTK